MIKLSDFLGKYKKNVLDTEIQNELVKKILVKAVGNEIGDKSILVKNKVAHIKGDSYLRTEILLKKEEILKEFKKNGLEIHDLK